MRDAAEIQPTGNVPAGGAPEESQSLRDILLATIDALLEAKEKTKLIESKLFGSPVVNDESEGPPLSAYSAATDIRNLAEALARVLAQIEKNL